MWATAELAVNDFLAIQSKSLVSALVCGAGSCVSLRICLTASCKSHSPADSNAVRLINPQVESFWTRVQVYPRVINSQQKSAHYKTQAFKAARRCSRANLAFLCEQGGFSTAVLIPRTNSQSGSSKLIRPTHSSTSVSSLDEEGRASSSSTKWISANAIVLDTLPMWGTFHPTAPSRQKS
jgi:hypothetical protein